MVILIIIIISIFVIISIISSIVIVLVNIVSGNEVSEFRVRQQTRTVVEVMTVGASQSLQDASFSRTKPSGKPFEPTLAFALC